MSSPAPAMTVGEVNSKACISRAGLWVVALFLPSWIVFSAVWAYALYDMDPVLAVAAVPWRLPTIFMWGAYMALVTAAMMYMHLYLPRAPFAVREALVNVGLGCVGSPLGVVGLFVAAFGHTWMLVAVVALIVVLIARVLALWVWLVRTYGDECRVNFRKKVEFFDVTRDMKKIERHNTITPCLLAGSRNN